MSKKTQKGFRGPGAIPPEGRIPCKVHNNLVAGAEIEGCFCGTNFQIQAGKVMELHPSQIEILHHATIETTEHQETDHGWKVVPITIPRFTVEIMTGPGAMRPKVPADQAPPGTANQKAEGVVSAGRS